MQYNTVRLSPRRVGTNLRLLLLHGCVSFVIFVLERLYLLCFNIKRRRAGEACWIIHSGFLPALSSRVVLSAESGVFRLYNLTGDVLSEL